MKTPLFVIKRDNATGEDSKDAMEDDAVSDEEDEMFVQEEYDLANNVDQMVTRLSQFDEYSHLRTKVTQCH